MSVRCITCATEVAEKDSNCPGCGAPAPAKGVDAGATEVIDGNLTSAMTGIAAPLSSAPRRANVSRISVTSVVDEGRFPPGTLLAGRYRVISLLGRGGMGEVYRATDMTLAQSVALKFLPESAAGNIRLLERFHNEVRIARQVSHPNVCRVYDIGEAEGLPYISMEYIDGEDLAGLLQRIGRLPPDKALETARKICAGLAAAHGRGVIHRDLKPQNIMLDKRGEVVIMDFGLAAAADHLTGPEARNGTPAYMAPEQLKGQEASGRSDIYSLGLVLYEVFTGRKAFDATTVADLIGLQESAHFAEMTSIAHDVDPAVQNIVRKCLHPDPAQRPPTPLAVAAALPGGDPLAAALAAGETPSPELVAASGATSRVPLKYALPCLIGVLGSLAFLPPLTENRYAHRMANLPYPPDALTARARDIAAEFGYGAQPADYYREFDYNNDLVKHFETKKRAKDAADWLRILNAEPPVGVSYRQSPRLLKAPMGRVTDEYPPPRISGMAYVLVNGNGELRAFEGVPPQVDDGPAGEFDPAAAFRAAGFDIANFQEAAPEWTPAVAFDSRRAWKAQHPRIAGLDVTVQISAWRGKVTEVLFAWPWTKPDRQTATPPETRARAASIAQSVTMGGLLFGVLFLAHRNLRLGRGDRKGANRLAILRLVLACIAWLGRAHFIPDIGQQLEYLGLNFSTWLADAAFLWLLYIALEPEVRSRWPHALIAWNRALAGNWMDSKVGWHILAGCALGMAMRYAFLGLKSLTAKPGDSPDLTNLMIALDASHWISYAAGLGRDALQGGLTIFMLIFGLRQLCKREWLAALLAAIILTAVATASSSSDLKFIGPFYFAAYFILVGGLLRFGLVTASVLLFTANATLNSPAGTDFNAWYNSSALMILVLIGALAVFGFWRSQEGFAAK